jgi:hypothetical protein
MSVVSAVDITYSSLFVAILQTIMNPAGLRYQKFAKLLQMLNSHPIRILSIAPSRILMN